MTLTTILLLALRMLTNGAGIMAENRRGFLMCETRIFLVMDVVMMMVPLTMMMVMMVMVLRMVVMLVVTVGMMWMLMIFMIMMVKIM